MKTALKIGLFVFWICWVALAFWQIGFDDPLMNLGALVVSAIIMVALYFFYGVFLPAVVKVIWTSLKQRPEK